MVSRMYFSGLIRVFVTAPVLAYPYFKTLFILDADSSDYWFGSMLTQENKGLERVVAYLSPERNYFPTWNKLLAAVKSIEHFHHFYWRKSVVRADLASLQWCFRFRILRGNLPGGWKNCSVMISQSCTLVMLMPCPAVPVGRLIANTALTQESKELVAQGNVCAQEDMAVSSLS